MIPAGWIQNAVTLIDPSKSSRSYETTTRQSDGGVRELNLVLQGLVRLTRKLESFHCDSPIPINTFLTTSKLATLPHLTKLHLNLSQPPLNFSRHRDTADIVPQQGKYNPAISRWGVLPLKDLRLYGFSEVGGQVHTLVAAVAGSLRNLALETSAEIQQELVLPPLALDTLTLRGFTISSLPSTVQTLTLLNCAGDPEFTTANITTFSTDCANFLYLAVEAVQHGGKKDISFIPSVPVDITSLLKNTLRLHRLILSPSCILPTPVLHEFLLSGCSLAELELPVTSAQWGDFVRAFAMLRWIKKVGVWIAGLEGKEKGRKAEELVQEGDVAGMHLVEVRVNGVGWKVKSGGRMERMGETPERALVLGGGVKVVGMGRGSLVNT